MQTVLIVAGTRPEAIKLAPVAHALRRAPDRIRTVLCLTGQHRELVDNLVKPLGLTVDHDLDVMSAGQSTTEIARKVLERLPTVLALERPDMVLVQGDTVSATIAALAAFYAGIRVGHVEAGLRTGRLDEPFPEEGNRRLIAAISSIHFAPTQWAADNLLREGVAEELIEVTGNTGIDSFRYVAQRLPNEVPEPLRSIEWGDRRPVLVTVHRRENQTHHLRRICEAVWQVAEDEPYVHMVFPMHPSPAVRDVVVGMLTGHPRISLIEPLDYLSVVWLLTTRCTLVLTDSGGLQEEAAAAGRPVLVLRGVTDRPEGVQHACAVLVGSDVEDIVSQAKAVLRADAPSQAFAHATGLYGDGHAADRVAASVIRLLHRPDSRGVPGVMSVTEPVGTQGQTHAHDDLTALMPPLMAAKTPGVLRQISAIRGDNGAAAVPHPDGR